MMGQDRGPTTVEAVECKACGTLWKATSDRYLIITAQLDRPGDQRKIVCSLPVPTVICDTQWCLLKVLNLSDD